MSHGSIQKSQTLPASPLPCEQHCQGEVKFGLGHLGQVLSRSTWASMAYTPRRGYWLWALGMDEPMDEGDLAASPESLTFTSSLPHTHRQEATQGFLPVPSLPVNSGHWPMQYASPLQMLLGGSHWVPMVLRSSLHPGFSSHRGPNFRRAPDPFP